MLARRRRRRLPILSPLPAAREAWTAQNSTIPLWLGHLAILQTRIRLILLLCLLIVLIPRRSRRLLLSLTGPPSPLSVPFPPYVEPRELMRSYPDEAPPPVPPKSPKRKIVPAVRIQGIEAEMDEGLVLPPIRAHSPTLEGPWTEPGDDDWVLV